MWTALLKKQWMEGISWLLIRRRDGNRRSDLMTAALLMVCVACLVGWGLGLYAIGNEIWDAASTLGLEWFYFAVMGLVSLIVGVVGCIISTYATLYKAKDNGLLLAMPIPPSRILTVRLLGVWGWAFLDQLVVLLPALLVGWTHRGGGASAITLGLLLMLAFSLLIVALACLFGWLVAAISAHIRHKTLASIVLIAALIYAYAFLMLHSVDLIPRLLTSLRGVGAGARGGMALLYWMGRAGEGLPAPTLLIALIAALLFAAVYGVLSLTFLRMATQPVKVAKRAYREKATRRKGLLLTLLSKEFRHFLSCPVYLVNCGMGVLLTLIAGIVLLVKAKDLRGMLTILPMLRNVIGLIACAAICMLGSFSNITAPSVSLEGKTLWLSQSLPISPWMALKAKLCLHLCLVEPAVLFYSACVIALLLPSAVTAFFLLFIPALFVLLCACVGLMLNLLMPNLKWTDETVPVKQSLSALFSILGGWVVLLALGSLYYALRKAVSITLFFALVLGLLALLNAVLLWWLKTAGSRIFRSL